MNKSLPKFLCGYVPETPDDCHGQALHVAGKIQSIGAMLVLAPDGRQVIGASDNLQQILDIPAAEALGTPLEKISPQIANEIAGPEMHSGALFNVLNYVHEFNGITYDVSTYCHEDHRFLEFQPNGNPTATLVRRRIRECSSACTRIISADDFAQASQIATDAARAITGFDRVNILRALTDRSGAVETESKPDAMASHLGLHQRINDMPAAACQTIRFAPCRAIATVSRKTVAVRTLAGTCTQLDQTGSALRAASAMQRAYLRNRGILATFSIALSYNDRLWGIIEGQHRFESVVPVDCWTLVQQIANALMMKKRQIDDTAAQIALSSENEALRQFAHTTAHDIRAPLRGIKMALDWMEEDGFNKSTVREHHSLASTSATKLQAFTEGLIELSLIFEQPLEFHHVDLDAVISDVQDLLAPELKATGGRFVTDPLPRLKGDQVMLTRLFLNLASNALKYRHHDAPPVIAVKQMAGTSLTLEVFDNGTGIEPKHAETIFEPTKRLVHASDVAGNGLGLAMARRIMDLHGGSIRLDHTYQQGARFVMEFPLTP